MNNRNPSLTLEMKDVDRFVDLIMKGKAGYISQASIVQMNITDITAYNYVQERWNYRQRNHVTRRCRTLMVKIKAALGSFKAQEFVWQITVSRGYYDSAVVGAVCAVTDEDAIQKAKVVYGAGVVAAGISETFTIWRADRLGPGGWQQVHDQNAKQTANAMKRITEARFQIEKNQNAIVQWTALACGYNIDQE